MRRVGLRGMLLRFLRRRVVWIGRRDGGSMVVAEGGGEGIWRGVSLVRGFECFFLSYSAVFLVVVVVYNSLGVWRGEWKGECVLMD